MVKQFLDLVLDTQKLKPTFSKSLLELDHVDGAISNLLPLASTVLGDAGSISKASKRLCDGGEVASNIRALFAQILEATFTLSEHCQGNETCQWPRWYTKMLRD